MAQTLALVAGIAVLAALTADLVLTTIGAVARPVVAHRVGAGTFALMRMLAGRWPVVSAFLVGPSVMVAVGGFWVLGFSLAWTLVYLGGDPAITLESGGAAAPVDVWAHVGHLLSTLGGATTQPASGAWNAVGVAVGVNGMVALTLAVSFTLATTNTVAAARAFARRVALDAEEGALDPATHEEALSEIVAAMGASPFAAYYLHPDRRSLFTAAAQRLDAAAGGRARLRLRRLLADLPDFAEVAATDDAAFRAELARWCRARSFPAAMD